MFTPEKPFVSDWFYSFNDKAKGCFDFKHISSIMQYPFLLEICLFTVILCHCSCKQFSLIFFYFVQSDFSCNLMLNKQQVFSLIEKPFLFYKAGVAVFIFSFPCPEFSQVYVKNSPTLLLFQIFVIRDMRHYRWCSGQLQ